MSEPTASEVLKLYIEHEKQQLESDSILASCQCLTKTNDPAHHKPGCKYRLICERNEARQLLADAKTRIADLEGQSLNWRLSSVCRNKQAEIDRLQKINSDQTAGIHLATEAIAALDRRVEELLKKIDQLPPKS